MAFSRAEDDMGKRTRAPSLGKIFRVIGWLVAWFWAILAGGGGLGLIITRGPLPLTNGWFALLSGISACPLTAGLLKRYYNITLRGWTRFTLAVLFIVIGRLVLKVEGRGTFLPNFS